MPAEIAIVIAVILGIAGFGALLRAAWPRSKEPTVEPAPTPRSEPSSTSPPAGPPPRAAASPLSGLTLDISYADAEGQETARRITLKDARRDYLDPTSFDMKMDAWCHLRQAERTFLTRGVRAATVVETGEVIEGPLLGIWLRSQRGDAPFSHLSGQPPGRVSTRRPNPPLPVTVTWERDAGDLETFDVEIDEVEFAGGVPFAFSGRARRRKSETDRAWTGRRRFKLRMTTHGDAAIRTFQPTNETAPHPAPHRWLAEQTGRS